jgi:hypothetical protein
MTHLQQLRRQPRPGKVCRKLGREAKAAAGNNTPIEYKDTLILGNSQLLMTLQIFLSTNNGTTFIFVVYFSCLYTPKSGRLQICVLVLITLGKQGELKYVLFKV